MKRVIVVAMVWLGLMAFGSGLVGQDLPMIGSVDMLRTYALEQSATVSGNIGAFLPTGSKAVKQAAVQRHDAIGIVEVITSLSLAADVINPNDNLTTSVGVYDTNGLPLFYGTHQFKLLQDKAGWSMPPDYGNVDLVFSENGIPISVKGAQYAQIVFRDDKGQSTMAYELRVQDGMVLFPWQLAGANAILSVLVGDWTTQKWVNWDISRNGAQITPIKTGVSLNPTIRGVITFANEVNINVGVKTEDGIGQNLTVEYHASGKQLLPLTFATTEGKFFSGLWYRKAGTADWTHFLSSPDKDVGQRVWLNIPSDGVYYFIPVWKEGDLVEPASPWQPQPVDGGKG